MTSSCLRMIASSGQMIVRVDNMVGTYGNFDGSLRSFMLILTGVLTSPPISSSNASSSMSGTPPWLRTLGFYDECSAHGASRASPRTHKCDLLSVILPLTSSERGVSPL